MPKWTDRHSVLSTLLIVFLLLMLHLDPVPACGPGRGGNRRRSPRKLTPLVFKQHVPNVSENTISAAGFKEGKVTRHDSRFKDLVPNYNPDVIFKDEEGTGADRLMTRRLKEKLNTLAISVMNQWPGVRLRVTEGWDEESHHAADSLHYEGRAVDITTSDRDRSKYGMLARLAVEAGFDWVYYESRYHIHCSVKSEKSDAARNGGCFNANSYVTTPGGQIPIRDLAIGDEVLAIDSNGQPVFSPVLLFLDRDATSSRLYYKISTESGKTITMTGSHLIFVMDELKQDFNSSFEEKRVVFARQITPDQFVLSADQNGQMQLERVTLVEVEEMKGAYAPLTREGNLIVNNVLASCYANIRDQWLAHVSFFPVRSYSNFVESMNHLFPIPKRKRRDQSGQEMQSGIHWYPRLLQSIAVHVLPSGYLE